MKYRILICLYIILGVINTCIAAEWDNVFGLGFTAGYTDNIKLASVGNEESQYYLQVSPYIGLHGEGGRARLDLDYKMQSYFYQSSEYDTQIYHQLFANANVEFIEKFFFLDLKASNFQNAITAAASIPQDNVSITNNRTNVTTTTISPYINTRISSRADLLLRYTLENTKYDKTDVIQPDTENKNYFAEISSTAASGQSSLLDWRLGYLRNEFNTNLVETNYYAESSFRLYYNLSSQFIPYTTVGNETNKIIGTSFSEGGSFWDVGLTWRPTPRTSISGAVGERFYGKSREFSWATTGKHTNIEINYTESPTNTGQVFAQRQPINVSPPGSENEFIPIIVRPYLRKRLASNIRYNYSKTNLNWYLFNEKRIFLAGDPDEETSYGTTLSWNWKLTGKTSPGLSAGWQRFQQDTPTLLDNELLNFNLSIAHTISARLFSSLTYNYQKQHSNIPQNKYIQNRILLNITLQLDKNN